MDSFGKFMSRWQQVLNEDAELKERNKSFYSTVEGMTAVQLEVEKQPAYVIDVKGGSFAVHAGSAVSSLLRWRLSLDLFKDVMLGKYRLVYGLLDPRGELSFDTSNFTHWNGATVIEVLFLAQDMTVRDGDLSRLVKGL